MVIYGPLDITFMVCTFVGVFMSDMNLLCSQTGQLGLNNTTNIASPKLVSALKDSHIAQISCGSRHSCAISQDGRLFATGYNQYGQCGLGKGIEKILQPTEVDLNGLKALYVSCGDYHTLVLTTNGVVLSFGHGKHGQLGHGNRLNLYQPTIIETLSSKRMIDIAAGEKHSLCISEVGELFSFGNGAYG